MADNVSVKRKKSAKNHKSLMYILISIVVVVLFYLIAMAFSHGYEIFTMSAVAGGAGEKLVVVIPDGSSHSEVTDILYRKGLIEDRDSFKALLSLYTSSSYDVLPGEYTLNTNMEPEKIIESISGKITKKTEAGEHLGLYKNRTKEDDSSSNGKDD